MLRINPTRVIVGRPRQRDAEGMLKAMSQGNDGSMCSIHANSASSALGRLAVYADEAGYDLEAANLRIAEAIDLYIIHIGWVGQDTPHHLNHRTNRRTGKSPPAHRLQHRVQTSRRR